MFPAAGVRAVTSRQLLSALYRTRSSRRPTVFRKHAAAAAAVWYYICSRSFINLSNELALTVSGGDLVQGYNALWQRKWREAQLSQRDRAMLCVVEYFVKLLKVTQDYSKWHPYCNHLCILYIFWDIQRQIMAWHRNLGWRSLKITGNSTTW